MCKLDHCTVLMILITFDRYWWFCLLLTGEAKVWGVRGAVGGPGCHGDGKVREWWCLQRWMPQSVVMAAFIQPSDLLCVISVCQFSSHGCVPLWEGKIKVLG